MQLTSVLNVSLGLHNERQGPWCLQDVPSDACSDCDRRMILRAALKQNQTVFIWKSGRDSGESFSLEDGFLVLTDELHSHGIDRSDRLIGMLVQNRGEARCRVPKGLLESLILLPCV